MSAAIKQDPTVKLIKDLREFRDELVEKLAAVEQSIAALESGRRRGPGRPPKSNSPLRLVGKSGDKPKTKPDWSTEKRKEVSARMKKYWADQRKKKVKKVREKTSKAEKPVKKQKTTPVFASS